MIAIKLHKNNNSFYSLILISLLTVLPCVAFASEKPDFSGNWSLNSEKSKLGDRGWADKSKIIKQDSINLIVERAFKGWEGEDINMTDRFTLDGKICDNEGFRNSERKSTAMWSEDGKDLIIKTKVTFERDGETDTFEFTENMSLSEDGVILTIVSSSEMGSQTMVYDKK